MFSVGARRKWSREGLATMFSVGAGRKWRRKGLATMFSVGAGRKWRRKGLAMTSPNMAEIGAEEEGGLLLYYR